MASGHGLSFVCLLVTLVTVATDGSLCVVGILFDRTIFVEGISVYTDR